MNIETNKLGLPLEYQMLPELFDAHNITNNTKATNKIIEKLLRQHGVKTVLDLSCGTGSQVFFLNKFGYKVTGADFSPPLLEIARKKARRENVSITFLDGDMRKLEVGKFDAVITIFNAIGHLSKTDFNKTLKNIYNNLHEGGFYLFDIFNLEAMTANTVNNLAMNYKKIVDNKTVHHIQHSTINRVKGQIISYDNYIIDKVGAGTKKINNKFTLQIYKAKELQSMLAKNGFKTLKQCGIDGSDFKKNKTINMLTLAQKKTFNQNP